MSAEATCPKCLTRLRGPDSALGRTVECPRCRQVFRFPPSASASPSAVGAPPGQHFDMRVCPVCNAQLRATARACGECGTNLAPPGMETGSGARPVPSPAPPAYPPFAYQGATARQARNSGLAVASLVLGLLGLCGIGSILAIIFGAVAIRQIDESNGALTGKGMAKAGLVLGIIWLAILAIWWAAALEQWSYL